MRQIAIGVAAAAFLAIASPVSAQTYGPGPADPSMLPPPPYAAYPIGSGSETDHPTHMPTDFDAGYLNGQELQSLDQEDAASSIPAEPPPGVYGPDGPGSDGAASAPYQPGPPMMAPYPLAAPVPPPYLPPG